MKKFFSYVLGTERISAHEDGGGNVAEAGCIVYGGGVCHLLFVELFPKGFEVELLALFLGNGD